MATLKESIPELFTPHLTMKDASQAISETHIGQAHIAGTGPSGETCRNCAKWGVLGTHRYEASSQDDIMIIEPSICGHPIANKAHRRVPHDALSCRFFSKTNNPPPAERERRRKKPEEGGCVDA